MFDLHAKHLILSTMQSWIWMNINTNLSRFMLNIQSCFLPIASSGWSGAEGQVWLSYTFVTVCCLTSKILAGGRWVGRKQHLRLLTYSQQEPHNVCCYTRWSGLLAPIMTPPFWLFIIPVCILEPPKQYRVPGICISVKKMGLSCRYVSARNTWILRLCDLFKNETTPLLQLREWPLQSVTDRLFTFYFACGFKLESDIGVEILFVSCNPQTSI